MAATSLSSGPILGTLTASGSSPVFSTVANQPALVVIGLSRLATTSTPQLMRSSDGGNTWTAVTMASPGPIAVPWGGGVGPSTLFSAVITDSVSTQYRVDVSLSSGSAVFFAENNNVYPTSPFRTFPHCQIIEPGDANGSILSVTTAQLLNLFNLRTAPLSLSQIASPLTIYKRLFTGSPHSATAGAIAKLSVPSGALTGFDNSSLSLGLNRSVRASSVQVVSVMDSNANNVGSGIAFTGDGSGNPATYTTGATVNAVDLALSTASPNPHLRLPTSTGSFGGSGCYYGVHGFTTLLEAICAGRAPVSLAAFGL